MKKIVAIDPGASGAFCELVNGDVVMHKMPDTDHDVYNLVTAIFESTPPSDRVVYLEKVGGFMGSRAGEGDEKHNMAAAHTMFKFGQNYGFLRGVLTANHCRIELVVPRTWQKDLAIAASGVERKRRLKEVAQQRHPDLSKKITLQTCDALLLFDYGCRKERENVVAPAQETLL